MQPKVLVDYELAVARQGYVVRALLRIDGQLPAGDRRVPLNLSLVLDRSGSMAGEKLDRAQEAAAFLARRLRAEDVVSVVAYDDEVTTVAPPSAGSPDLVERILAIPPGGCTNLSGGWLRGHELVAAGQRSAADGTMHRVLLLTDGLANVGITEPDALVGLCRAAARKGVTTSTIGFGADYDEGLLRLMADAGGGNTWYIERPDQAAGVFEEEIEGLLTVAAQNVAVELRQSDAVQLVAVHNQYPSTPTAGGVRVELGDLYAREPKSLLVEFFVPGLGDRDAVSIADVVLTAYVLTEGGGVERQEITVTIRTPLDAAGAPVPEVRRELLLLDAACARDEAVARRRRGDFDGASHALRETLAAMQAAPDYGGEALAEQVADLSMLASKLERQQFDEADAKYAAQRAYNARRGKERYEEKLRRSPPT